MSKPRTEAQHPEAPGLQDQPPAVILERLLAGHAHAAAIVAPAIPAITDAAERAAATIRGGGRLAYAGAGSAGLMAMADALELAGTFSIAGDRAPLMLAGGPAALLDMEGRVEDDTAAAAGDLARHRLGAGDTVIAVSASGTTPYTLAVAAGARADGAGVVGIANVAGSPLLKGADVAILLDSGPELVAGSTRLGAATAQKIALNMMSTLMGVRLGHVHDGYMVNVRADNIKLRDRAARIVSAVTGADAGRAQAALDAADGAVKPAILIAAGAPDAAAAAALLDASDGHLGPALAGLGRQP